MPHEIAKLRLMYGLIREHVEASRRGLQEVDPESNPLLDPRSVSYKPSTKKKRMNNEHAKKNSRTN